MKEIVSISIGSSTRNKTVEAEFLGEKFKITREGTDGDFDKAIQRISELDGKVDCFGMGGTDLYLWRRGQRYIVRDALRMAKAAKITPMVDGSDLKHTLERDIVLKLKSMGIFKEGMKCLLVSGIDRWGMAEALAEIGLKMVYGDLIFALKINHQIKSLNELNTWGFLLLPIVTRLPFKLIYPTGSEQEKHESKRDLTNLFKPQDIIAGDFHYIKRHMPKDMGGKIILTNTTTEDDEADLKNRGVKLLITTTPVIDGRSFGTNVIQGVMVCIAGKKPEDLKWSDYSEISKRMKLEPNIRELNK